MPSYGGKALIEGILMQVNPIWLWAMRAAHGSIVIQKRTGCRYFTPANSQKSRFYEVWYSMGCFCLGIRYLTISANTQTEKMKIEEQP